MQGGQIRTVQALRAIACLMVVIFHTLPASPHPWPNGAAGVDLFFVISGYVMVVASRGRGEGWRAARRFLVHRARRIVPLYWLMTAIKLGITTWRPGDTPHTHPTILNVAASLLFIPARDQAGAIRPPLSVGWTLNFEAVFYVLFAAAIAARLRPLWIVPALAGMALFGAWRDDSWPAPLSLLNCVVLEFAAGMIVAVAEPRAPRRLAPWLVAGGFLLLVSLPSSGSWHWLLRGVPAAFILAGSLALESTLGARLPRWLLATGDASYAIYLVHPLVVPALYGHGVATSVASVVAAVAAGLLVHRYVDVPMQRWLATGRSRLAPQAAGAGVLSG